MHLLVGDEAKAQQQQMRQMTCCDTQFLILKKYQTRLQRLRRKRGAVEQEIPTRPYYRLEDLNDVCVGV